MGEGRRLSRWVSQQSQRASLEECSRTRLVRAEPCLAPRCGTEPFPLMTGSGCSLLELVRGSVGTDMAPEKGICAA